MTDRNPTADRSVALRWIRAGVVLGCLLLPVVWAVQKLFDTTGTAIRDTAASVGEVVGSVGQAAREVGEVASLARAALQPAVATRDPATVDEWLKSSFRISPPPGYGGGIGIRVQMLGKTLIQLSALVPQGAMVGDIFQGANDQIRFSPGPHTLFIAAHFLQATPAEAAEAFAAMEQADRQQPQERIFIPVDGKRVAALRGAFERHGQWNTAVTVFLDHGRIFHAVGPKDRFDEPALTHALSALTRAHPADDLLYAHATASPRRVVSVDHPCGVPGLKGDFDVVGISIARGSREIDEAIDTSGQRAATEDVVVGATPRPVLLLLMGEAPIVWRVGLSDEARIAGVLAQGRDRQVVLGLPPSIPLTTYSGSDGQNACPHFRPNERDARQSRERALIEARVRDLFGRGIDQLITHKANQRFQVGIVGGPIRHAGSLDIAGVALPDHVMPGGQAGLDWLIRHGKLRVAKPEELDAWRRGFEARTGRPQDPRTLHPMVGDAYVLLGNTRVPYLAGANSRLFIVPPELPLPAGDRGHSSFLLLDGFSCVGTLPICRL